MAKYETKDAAGDEALDEAPGSTTIRVASMDSEDEQLAVMGYKPEMKREFTWFAIISFAFSVTGILAGAMATFYTPLAAGGPVALIWAWFWGSFGCLCIGLSVAELVSAYPTDGGLYYTIKHVVPSSWVPLMGWIVGWMNLLGQIACSASVDFALASQITATAALGTDYTYDAPNAHTVAVMMGCLLIHGTLNSLPTKYLARLSSMYTIVNVGGIFAAIIALLVTCKDKNSASYVFTHFESSSGWSNNGISFCIGLLAVAWTMTDYDATAHITEETAHANVRAPVAIIIAVVLTAVLGWALLIVLVFCMGTDIASLLAAPSGLPVALIYRRNLGKGGALAMMVLTILVQNATCMVCMQSCARTIFALSRDGMLPFSRTWSTVNKWSRTPVYAVWLICCLAALLGLLDLASYYAAEAIFSVTSIALDWSYVIPVICKVIFAGKIPYQPGPIHFGRLSTPINIAAFCWVAFVSVILCFPQSVPVEKTTMNYSSVVFVGWLLLASGYWFYRQAQSTPYLGPGAKAGLLRVSSSSHFD